MAVKGWEYLSEWICTEYLSVRANALGALGWELVVLERRPVTMTQPLTWTTGQATVTIAAGYHEGWQTFWKREK